MRIEFKNSEGVHFVFEWSVKPFTIEDIQPEKQPKCVAKTSKTLQFHSEFRDIPKGGAQRCTPKR